MRLLLLLLLLFSFNSFGQGATCDLSTPFCSDTALVFPNTFDGSTAEVGPDYGDLGTQPNPAWYFVGVDNAGDIDITISQVSLTGAALDVDYICYGPFVDSNAACSGQLTSGNIISSSFSPNAVESFQIENAQPGQFYIVLITNFSGQEGNITFEQTNIGQPGAGTTDCSLVCSITLPIDQTFCVDNPYTITSQLGNSSLSSTATYKWFKNGTPIAGEGSSTLVVNSTVVTTDTYTIELSSTECDDPDTDTIIISYIDPFVDFKLNNITSLDECVDVATGLATVNLRDNEIEIANLANVTDYTFTYFEDSTQTTQITTPNNYDYNTGATIYVDIQHNSQSTCNEETQFEVELLQSPDIASSETVSYCLSAFPSTISLGSGFINGVATDYTYLWSNGEVTEAIAINTLGDYTVIITDVNGCQATRTITVIEGGAFVNAEPNFVDSDRNYCNNTFPATIELLPLIENNNLLDYTYQWSSGELTSSINVNIAGIYTLTVTNADGCEEKRTVTVSAFDFFPNPEPNFVLQQTETYCQDDYPAGLELAVEFENNNISDYTFLWSTGETTSSIEVNLENDYTVEITNPQGCSEIKTFTVTGSSVFNSTEANFEDETIYYCQDTYPTNIDLLTNIENNNVNDYTIQWSLNGVIINDFPTNIDPIIGRGENIAINETGVYELTVENSDGCIISRTVTVLPSSIPVIEEILTSDTRYEDRVSIEVEVSGVGDYLYGLDVDPLDLDNLENYQAENYFNNVLYGVHLITVIDQNGCLPYIQKEIVLVSYPKFMTPNNDGKFDTWNIDNEYNVNARNNKFRAVSDVIIFNRFGKIMTTLSAGGLGWNGNYNGEKAEPGDYWFTVDFTDYTGRIFTKRGHFSLL